MAMLKRVLLRCAELGAVKDAGYIQVGSGAHGFQTGRGGGAGREVESLLSGPIRRYFQTFHSQSGREGGGRSHLLLTLAIRAFTAHPHRDGAPILLLLETPATFGLSSRVFHTLHIRFFACLTPSLFGRLWPQSISQDSDRFLATIKCTKLFHVCHFRVFFPSLPHLVTFLIVQFVFSHYSQVSFSVFCTAPRAPMCAARLLNAVLSHTLRGRY